MHKAPNISRSRLPSQIEFRCGKPARLFEPNTRSYSAIRCGSTPQYQNATVAVPDSTASPTPTVPPSWLPIAGIAATAAALTFTARHIYLKLRHRPSSSHTAAAHHPSTSAPLTASTEDLVASVGPLLLAAETAAGIDETSSLSDEELDSLDLQVRMLIQDMDSQLFDIQDSVANLLTEDAIRRFDEITSEMAVLEDSMAAALQSSPQEDGKTTNNQQSAAAELDSRLTQLQFQAFEILAPHYSDSDKRTYRSLLYNRSVQQRLQGQIERQLRQRKQDNQSTKNTSSYNTNTNQKGSDGGGVTMLCSGSAIPHPLKAETGGEDAFFCRGNTFAVADGVSGWASLGVDPAEYPQALITAIETNFRRIPDPYTVLEAAFNEVDVAGSCTLAMASLDPPTSHLKIVTLGDCEVRIYRNVSNVFSTEIQEHSFNQPYQLSHESFNAANVPEDSLKYDVQVQPGDVIVAASDGLWDNVWDDEIAQIVQQGDLGAHAEDVQQDSVRQVAKKLTEAAKQHSEDPVYDSPFSVERNEKAAPQGLTAFLSKRTGGKQDDITVIVALIVV